MEDDAVVRIISRLGVDYSQALLSTRQLANETDKLNAKLLNLRLTVADLNRVGTISLAQQLKGDKVIYDQYGRVLSVVDSNIKKITSATETATQAAKRHAVSVKDLNDQYNVLASQWERRTSWFLAGGLMFGSVEAIRQAATTISQVEMGMTTIARVTEDASFNFKGVRDQLLRMGVEYGMTWDKVSDIMTRWVQAGHSVSESLELTRASLLALNTAELDANYACAA